MMKIYHYETCPYCAKVRSKLSELKLSEGKDFKLIDARRGTPGSEELVSLGGKQQVPFLVDGDTQMYESDDINEYLENKFA